MNIQRILKNNQYLSCFNLILLLVNYVILIVLKEMYFQPMGLLFLSFLFALSLFVMESLRQVLRYDGKTRIANIFNYTINVTPKYPKYIIILNVFIVQAISIVFNIGILYTTFQDDIKSDQVNITVNKDLEELAKTQE